MTEERLREPAEGEDAATLKWRRLSFAVYEQKLADLVRMLNDSGLEPLLIKGWAAARYYPEPWKRDPGDVDLVFRAEEADEAKRLLEGYKDLDVDIHAGLRHLDSSAFEDVMQASASVAIADHEVRVPSAEDHLRILATHWLADGGTPRHKLRDIYWLVERRPEGFSWEECLTAVPPHRARWVTCAIGLARRELGLDTSDIPVSKEALEVPEWIERAVDREETEPDLIPIHFIMRDPRALFLQLRKRIWPNPLIAVISLDKSIDTKIRVHFLLESLVKRAFPAVPRVAKTLFGARTRRT